MQSHIVLCKPPGNPLWRKIARVSAKNNKVRDTAEEKLFPCTRYMAGNLLVTAHADHERNKTAKERYEQP